MASSEIMASLFGLEFSALVMFGLPEGSLPGPVLFLLKQLVAEGEVITSNRRA